MRSILFAALSLAFACQGQDLPRPVPRQLGQIRLVHAAFVEAFPATGVDGARKYTLYVTTFDAGELLD